jgi:hypothetical protein
MGKFDRKRKLWRPRSKLENIKIDIKEIWFEIFELIQPTVDMTSCGASVKM